MAAANEASKPRRLYLAMIGDLTGSRRIADRAGVQRLLRRTLADLNAGAAGAGAAGAAAAPLKMVAGDEVQGLLADPAFAVEIAVRLADRLHPATMSWGLGWGELTTDLDQDVSVVDGPCFHRARKALAAAARDRGWVAVEGLPGPHDQVLTAVFRLLSGVRSRWTETQVRYVRAARGRLQQEAAEELGVTKQSVSKTLDAAQFAHVQAGEEAAGELLRWVASLETAAERGDVA